MLAARARTPRFFSRIKGLFELFQELLTPLALGEKVSHTSAAEASAGGPYETL